MITSTDDLVIISVSLPDGPVLILGMILSTTYLLIAAWKWLKRIVL
ncbi:hypothetical protein ANRL4_02621 [Anaerolineae bacterium]|nr:hypothetical protein ANRL4_02621 [Anaerolineae bacterium]